MALTVLSVAYPLAPVGEDTVGGAEQILTRLDAALTRGGHRSLVVACEGSCPHGELIPIPAIRGPLTETARERAHAACREAIAVTLRSERVDLLHFHSLGYERALPEEGPPALVTLHLPLGWYAAEALHPTRSNTHLCCVSRAQANSHPGYSPSLPPMPNGVPLERLHPANRKRGFALMLGRICPEKGAHLALEAARRAGCDLLIAGQVFPYPEHARYFEAEVLPRLGPHARFCGPLPFTRKRRLLAAARCLLVPSTAEETSSLVAMEALACGTPVIAFRVGALPEVVEDGRTGFLVDGVEAMAEAIRRVDLLDPTTCRSEAERRFSAEAMCARYLALYEALAHRPHAPSRPNGERFGHNDSTLESICPKVRETSLHGVPSSVEVYRGVPALERLRDEWSELCDRCLWTTPFQRPEWLIPWARHFAGEPPSAIALRKGSRLAGLLLTLAYQDGAVRRGTLLGTGISDYLDVLLAPESVPSGAEPLMKALFACSDDVRAMSFEQLRPDSPLVRAPIPSGWAERLEPDVPWFAVPLREGVAGLPRKLRVDLGNARRRAERAGALRIEQAELARTSVLMEGLFRLHALRWGARGGQGVLAEDALRAFHLEVAAAMDRSGRLRLYGLWIDEALAAVLYGFQERGRLFLYLDGFDPSFSRISAGSQLLAHALERAWAEGTRTLDFLRGDEPYKRAWGAVEAPSVRRVMTRASA